MKHTLLLLFVVAINSACTNYLSKDDRTFIKIQQFVGENLAIDKIRSCTNKDLKEHEVVIPLSNLTSCYYVEDSYPKLNGGESYIYYEHKGKQILSDCSLIRFTTR